MTHIWPRSASSERAGPLGTRKALCLVSKGARHEGTALAVGLEETTGKRARVNLAALEEVQAQLNHMPHVGREPAFPDQATRLLFGL